MYSVIKQPVTMPSVHNFCLSRHRAVWCKNYTSFLPCIDSVSAALSDLSTLRHLNRDIGDIGHTF